MTHIQRSELRRFMSVCRYTGKDGAPFWTGSAKKASEESKWTDI